MADVAPSGVMKENPNVLKKIVLVVVAIIVVLVAVAYILPGSVHVERSASINAPAERIFALVNAPKEFNKWSPWYGRDPDAKYLFEGPEAGVGAKMTWQSDHDEVGSGTSEIIESVPNELLRTQLDFGDMGTAVAFFQLKPEGEVTNVTWGFDSELGMNPMARYMGLMFDEWVGGDYEEGLANLKKLAESGG